LFVVQARNLKLMLLHSSLVFIPSVANAGQQELTSQTRKYLFILFRFSFENNAVLF